MKAALKRVVISGVRQALRRDARPLPRLLESGFATISGRTDPEANRRILEGAFSELSGAGAAAAIGLEQLRPVLVATKYKYPLFGNRWSGSAGGQAFRLGSRLASTQSLHFDVLVLREGEQIPPHAHDGTVSGMLVVEGSVGFRTFDVLDRSSDGATLRPGLDGIFGPGGVSTSSDAHHNLHWIKGFAPLSLIFRYSLAGLVGEGKKESGPVEARHYCLPIRDASGTANFGRWVDQAEAKAATF